MKLILMTDFVLQRAKSSILPLTIKETFKNGAKVMNEIFMYADLLKKDLKKGMFVPCDEFDNILEEPKYYNEKYNDNIPSDEFELCTQYHEAKKRVLFKGFKVVYFSKKPNSIYSGSISDSSGIIHLFWLDKATQNWYLSHDLKTVEHLTILKCLELTETSLKEMGLIESKDND